MVHARLVLIGAGMIGREHAALIASHRDAELVGLADPLPEARTFSQQIGVRYYEDYTRLLDETAPDGAIVALPNALHEAAGMACIERGIACLMEKPIADTLVAAARLVDASEAAKVPILVGHHRRHSPDIVKARDLVAAGALGDLVAVNGLWLADKPDSYFASEWRRKSGGGPLLINLIHDIDCLRFIAGEIDSVAAMTANAVRNFEVEDTASIALRFQSGALGSFLISDAAASPFTWEHASGQALYFPHQPGDCYVFAGREASLAVPSMTLWRHESAGGHWQDPFVQRHVMLDGSRTYRNQLDHFLDVVAGRAAPLIDARDGMMTLAATLAVEAAARQQQTIRVTDMLDGKAKC